MGQGNGNEYKSGRVRWTGHVSRMGREEVHTGFWWKNQKEGDHLEDPGVDVRIILKRISEKWDREARIFPVGSLSSRVSVWRNPANDEDVLLSAGSFLRLYLWVAICRQFPLSVSLGRFVCCYKWLTQRGTYQIRNVYIGFFCCPDRSWWRHLVTAYTATYVPDWTTYHKT